MRHLISGLVAAVAVLAAAPAFACGYTPCAQPQVYVAPVATGCNPCNGGWVHERLADPEQQYYFVNQGPTYSGPGNWGPRPVYREGSISGYGYGYNRPYHHGYRHHHWHPRMSYHHGYAPYHYGHHVLRRYY